MPRGPRREEAGFLCFFCPVSSLSLLERLFSLLPTPPLAPNFLLRRGISNTAGTVAGIVGVAATGFLLDRAGGAGVVAGWDQAVLVSALTCLLGLGAFAGFARGERLFGADGPAAQH